MHPIIWKLHCIKSEGGWYVSGTVLKKDQPPQKIEGNWWTTFKSTIQTYFAKPYQGGIKAFWKDGGQNTSTNSDGIFSFECGSLDPDTIRFETSEGLKIEKNQTYPISFDMRKTPYMVISDIDDTILVSNSEQFFSKIWLMLFRQTDKRNFVEESEKAYRKLASAGIPFSYVSASEQNLFATITNFLIFHDLPIGPVFLRPYTHWKDLLKAKSRENYKVNRMMKLIKQFPETRFALFGDDSQQDPLAFKSILANFPNQIDTIMIRKTGSGNNETEIADLRNLATSKVRFAHYSEFKDIESIINEIGREYSVRS